MEKPSVEYCKRLQGHSWCVWSLCVVGTDRFCSGSSDGTARLWDGQKQVAVFDAGASVSVPIKSVCLGLTSRHEQVLFTGRADDTCDIWEVSTQRLVKTIPRPSLQSPSWSLFSWLVSKMPKDSRGINALCLVQSCLYIAYDELGLFALDWSVGMAEGAWSDPQPLNTQDKAWGLCSTLDGSCLVSAGRDGQIRVYTTTRAVENRLNQVLQGHSDQVLCVCASQTQASLVFSGSDDCTLRAWDVEAGSCLFLEEFDQSVISLATNGHFVYAVLLDNSCRIMVPRSSFFCPLRVIQNIGVSTVASNGEYLYLGSLDSNITVWRVKLIKEEDPSCCAEQVPSPEQVSSTEQNPEPNGRMHVSMLNVCLGLLVVTAATLVLIRRYR